MWSTELKNVSLCRVLKGKSPFSGLCGICSLILAELTAVLQHSAARDLSSAGLSDSDTGEFREQ